MPQVSNPNIIYGQARPNIWGQIAMNQFAPTGLLGSLITGAGGALHDMAFGPSEQDQLIHEQVVAGRAKNLQDFQAAVAQDNQNTQLTPEELNKLRLQRKAQFGIEGEEYDDPNNPIYKPRDTDVLMREANKNAVATALSPEGLGNQPASTRPATAQSSGTYTQQNVPAQTQAAPAGSVTADVANVGTAPSTPQDNTDTPIPTPATDAVFQQSPKASAEATQAVAGMTADAATKEEPTPQPIPPQSLATLQAKQARVMGAMAMLGQIGQAYATGKIDPGLLAVNMQAGQMAEKEVNELITQARVAQGMQPQPNFNYMKYAMSWAAYKNLSDPAGFASASKVFGQQEATKRLEQAKSVVDEFGALSLPMSVMGDVEKLSNGLQWQHVAPYLQYLSNSEANKNQATDIQNRFVLGKGGLRLQEKQIDNQKFIETTKLAMEQSMNTDQKLVMQAQVQNIYQQIQYAKLKGTLAVSDQEFQHFIQDADTRAKGVALQIQAAGVEVQESTKNAATYMQLLKDIQDNRQRMSMGPKPWMGKTGKALEDDPDKQMYDKQMNALDIQEREWTKLLKGTLGTTSSAVGPAAAASLTDFTAMGKAKTDAAMNMKLPDLSSIARNSLMKLPLQDVVRQVQLNPLSFNVLLGARYTQGKLIGPGSELEANDLKYAVGLAADLKAAGRPVTFDEIAKNPDYARRTGAKAVDIYNAAVQFRSMMP